MNQKVISASFIGFGFALLIYTWQPVIFWHFFQKPNFANSTLLSPLAKSFQNGNQQTFVNRANLNSGKNNDADGDFFLTVEKFGIAKAKVVTGDNFLTQLAHFPKSAQPGQVGNVVISGHSVLPQFFRPENYWSIFSKLYLMEIDDQIILETNNQTFTYSVTETLVVTPKDIWVLEATDQFGSYLTLLTCGVGGFTRDRIIIRATLVNSQKLI